VRIVAKAHEEDIDDDIMNQLRVPVYVVLMGPPASGKGTIADVFQEQFQWKIITPGGIYRKLREEDSEIGAIVRETLEKYHHCPDHLTNHIIREAVQDHLNTDCVLGVPARFVFDGYPRSLEQLSYLDQNYDVAAFLHIDAPLERLLDASIHRRYCKGCGKVFSAKNPPRITGSQIVQIEGQAPRLFMASICLRRKTAERTEQNEECAARGEEYWERRWDDGEEKYRERFQTFNEKTMPVIEAVSQRANYRKFQVLGNPHALGEIGDWLTTILGSDC
jgi:adenylate kinase family enzyme